MVKSKNIKTTGRKVVIIVLFAGVYFLGYLHGHQNLVFDNKLTPKIVSRDLRKPAEVDFSRFWDVYNMIGEKSLKKIDSEKAVTSSIKGLVESLGDPFSGYLTQDETKTFFSDLAGEFDGIGVQIAKQDDKLVVIAPLDGSPAKEAGLKAKDTITSIDGVAATSLQLDDAVKRIRGKQGSEVVLGVKHNGEDKSQEIKVKRKKITVPSVELKYIDAPGGGDIAVLKISQFGDDTVGLVQKVADEIDKKNPKAIIVDLRNNPGGYLDGSVDIASLFVDKGPIVLEEDSKGKIKEVGTSKSAQLDRFPLAVLINEGSASASEIFAGAVKDHKEGKIIGKKSFGKGTVQDLVEVGGGTLRITTHKWLTPDKTEINEKGINPDIEVGDDEKTEKDEQLDRAVEELKGEI